MGSKRRARTVFISFVVAVIVEAVADFHDWLAGIHGTCRRFAVCCTDHLSIASTCAPAYRAGIAESGGCSFDERGLEGFVNLVIAVVIYGIADFFGCGIDGRVFVVAVALGCEKAVVIGIHVLRRFVGRGRARCPEGVGAALWIFGVRAIWIHRRSGRIAHLEVKVRAG